MSVNLYIYNIYSIIYIHIYIYIYIGWTRWNGDTTSKNKLFSKLVSAVAVLKGCVECDLQVLKDIWRHFTTDVSYFRPYAETENNGGERKACMKWVQFRFWFRPSGAKDWISLFRNFLAVLVFLLMSQLMSCECFLVVLW